MTEPFGPRWNVWLCCLIPDRFRSYSTSWWCVHQLRIFSQACARLFLIWKFLSSRITHDRTVWSEVERVIVLFNCQSFLLIQQMLLVLFAAENVQSAVCRIYIWFKNFSPAQQHMTELFPPRWDVCLCCLIPDRFRSYNTSWWCVHQLRMFSQASARLFSIWRF